MTTRTRQRVRGRWVLAGAVVWLILASSISLEQGQDAVSEWGSALTLTVIGLLSLLAACRVALIPVRSAGRRLRRGAVRRPK